MSTSGRVQDQKQNPAKSQFNKILNQYVEQRHVHEDSMESIIEFKKKIDLKGTTVSSVKKIINMLNEILKEKEIKLWNEEQARITKLESLVRGCPDSQVLNNIQLAAYEDVWYIKDKYSDKE